MADLFRALAAASLAGFLTARVAQIAVYDGGAGVVRIPSVSVGDNIFTQLALKDLAACASPCRRPPSNRPRRRPPFARFDGATSILTIPALNVGSVNFTGVTLLHVGDLVFTVLGGTPTTAPPRVEAPARWLEAWTSSNADTRSGSYALSVVDASAPGAMPLVDGSVPVADFQGLVTRVRGGSYDPATGQVSDPGVRHLVFNRGGQLVRVSFDRSGSSPPTPVRLSTETAALRLTRNFIQIVPHSGTLITSVNKSDGRLVQADMPAGGLVRQWLNTGLVGPATSDRLFDWRNTGTRNLVGSIRADGSERRARQAARRLHAQHRAAGPAAVEQPGALSVSGHRVRRGTTLTSARTCCPLP